jgi:hypothetical protein
MQALFVGFPSNGTSARSGQPWHAGERSKGWRRCRRKRRRWGWGWWKLEMVYVKIRPTDVLGQRAPMAAGLARRRPPIVATAPAASQQRSSRTLLALVALVALLACRLPHRTRRWRACTHLRAALQPSPTPTPTLTPTRDTFQHLARPHGHTATRRPHTQRPGSGIIHTSSSEQPLHHRRHTSQLVARTVCTMARMHPFEHVPGSVPLFWSAQSFLSHTPRPPHPPDWPLPRCHTAATIAVNTTLLAGHFPVVAHASSSFSCPCRAA